VLVPGLETTRARLLASRLQARLSAIFIWTRTDTANSVQEKCGNCTEGKTVVRDTIHICWSFVCCCTNAKTEYLARALVLLIV
jgi:hypothetical protein